MSSSTKAFPRIRNGIGDTGNAAVEFALVLPVFLAVLFGILGLGLYLAVAHSVQQIASEAARATIAGLTQQERGELAVSTVASLVDDYALLRPDALIVAADADATTPDMTRVTVTYDASHLDFGSWLSLIGVDMSRIKRSAVVRRGGF